MKYLFTIILFLTFAFSVNAQVTLTQDEANKVFELAAKGKSFDSYKTQAEADIKARDVIIENLKVELARNVGMLTQSESNAVFQRAIIQAMIPMLKKKKVGLINLF